MKTNNTLCTRQVVIFMQRNWNVRVYGIIVFREELYNIACCNGFWEVIRILSDRSRSVKCSDDVSVRSSASELIFNLLERYIEEGIYNSRYRIYYD